MTAPTGYRFFQELRRRRVFRTAGLYVVAGWLVLQVADILFPGWGVPEEAIGYLFWALLLGFPVALVFGWIFDITSDGIRRTRPAATAAELHESLPLGRKDYLLLSVFVIVVGLLVYDATSRVLKTAEVEEPPQVAAEIMENSVAVLPFESLSADSEHEYFADGISEEILNRLSAFGELTVIARTSSFSFKDSGYDIGRISGLLGVEYLLQGSIRRDDGQVRIAAQLVDRTGVQLWTQTFDRELGRIFALQDEIAEAVATSIVPQISPPPAQERLPDFEAFQHYMAGRELLIRRPPNFRNLAHERLSRAIELEPDYAEAYAERAIVLILGARQSGDFQAQFDRAQQDIDSALALNSELAQAYAAQALLMQVESNDYAASEPLLRRALALDPNKVNVLNWLGGALTPQGRHDEAREVFERAARIDPLAPVINVNLASGEIRRGRFDEAERRLLRLLEVPQPSSYVHVQLFDLYFWGGRLPEALEVIKSVVLMHVEQQGRATGQGMLLPVYGTLGMWEEVERWKKRTEGQSPDPLRTRLIIRAQIGLEAAIPGYAEAANEFRETLDTAGIDLAELPRNYIVIYGNLLALAGDYPRAIEIIATAIDPEIEFQSFPNVQATNARHALAWAWLQTGETGKAAAMLGLIDEIMRRTQAEGRLHFSRDLFDYARNTVLLGDTERGVDLLEQAEQAGWRGYYGVLHDPRWDALREHPRFVEIMARVKADLDHQRAEVEAIDAEDDFAARVDAMIAAREIEAPRRRQPSHLTRSPLFLPGNN